MTTLRLLLPLLLAAFATGCATVASEPPVAPAPAALPEPPTAPPATAQGQAPVAAAPVPAVAVVDPDRPDVPVDLDNRGARTDLWERVRGGFAIPDLDNDLVRQSERWYATRPDYVQRMTDRGSRYLFYIVEEVDRRGLPMELALLPFIESAFNPQAMSHAKASGMWQFMPATGRDFDLQQNMFRDDRRDVLASTRAALDYLTRLFGMFGDWHLALAAYNWGEGNVQRAIRRNEAAGKPTDYESLRMPAETRQYVPKLQAVKNIVANPAAFGLELAVIENHPYFLVVPIERDIDVALVTQLAGISAEHFAQLNPQLNKPVILAAGTPQVLLPYENANAFVRNLQTHDGQLASWTAWTAPRQMSPAEAAKLVGMSEAQLREVNRIPPRMLVKAGSTLLVPRDERRVADVPPDVADTATILLVPEGPALRRVAFKVGPKGDSVAAIAKRYGTTRSNVARWNDVSTGARFRPGTQVVVYVPQRKASTKQAARPAARSATQAARPAAASATKQAKRPAAGGGSGRTAAAQPPGAKATSKAPTPKTGR
jgi:membrane-bound lytic murein transglycosylase D